MDAYVAEKMVKFFIKNVLLMLDFQDENPLYANYFFYILGI